MFELQDALDHAAPGIVQYNFSLPFQYDSLLCYTQVKVQNGMDKNNQT